MVICETPGWWAMASMMLVEGCISSWRAETKEMGAGDCFSFWLPVKPVTTTSFSFTLDSVSGRINGEYATADWVPVRYVNKGYPRDALAGMYRAARVGLVTPLRDGMNLVAKEYVAAQDPEDPGVLVLSQFAGASEQMGEALIVNPFNREEVAEAIVRGLAMDKAERIDRWRALMDGLRRSDVSAWRDAFVAALAGD